MVDMFVDTWIRGFQLKSNITKVNKYFVGILNSWIALPMKNTKSNIHQLKMISQYLVEMLMSAGSLECVLRH